jgi:hypothetical protein
MLSACVSCIQHSAATSQITTQVNEPLQQLSDIEFRQIWESFNKLRVEGRPNCCLFVANPNIGQPLSASSIVPVATTVSVFS